MEFRRTPIVLIAEDESLIAISYEEMVIEAGATVGGSFPTCKSAEEWLHFHHPDLAIIDIELRDGSSVELAKKLCGRNIPFFIVSGYPASQDVDDVFKSAPWIEKPLVFGALQSALSDLLSSKQIH